MLTLNTDDKSRLLALIRRAKSSHIRWRAYAQGLVSGADVDEDRVPVNHTDCKFGQWYFGEGSKQFGHLQVFRDIKGPHEMLHGVYGQIYTMVQAGDISGAHEKLNELIAISRKLLERIEQLESQIEAIE